LPINYTQTTSKTLQSFSTSIKTQI